MGNNANELLFLADGYYCLVEQSFFEVENYGINKLFRERDVTKIVNNRFFS